MTYELFIGDRTFSSWSLRGWLMLHKFDLSYQTHIVGLYSGTVAQDMVVFAPARLVPALRTPEGDVVGESLAMAETLAERHPEIAMWPSDPAARIRARWLSAEMVGGFGALRGDCAMQLAHVDTDFRASEAVKADLARIETLWAYAREKATDGPWLFGQSRKSLLRNHPHRSCIPAVACRGTERDIRPLSPTRQLAKPRLGPPNH